MNAILFCRQASVMQIQPFSDDGGYTCLTNYVLDVVMPSLPPNAWKVLCFVIRKTRGWNKERDRLSYCFLRRNRVVPDHRFAAWRDRD